MIKLSGVSLIFWCKRREERFVAKLVIRTKFDQLTTLEQALKLVPADLKVKSIKIIKNIGKLYAPSILVLVDFSDMYKKYTMVPIETLFPYLYEPTPGSETYLNTNFYKRLYYQDQYDDLDSCTARTIFQNYLQITNIL